MTNFTTKLIAAAAMVVAASTASAQTMKATIPFAYEARGKAMAAGTYWVSLDSNGLVAIRNENGHTGVLALGSSRIDGGKSGEAKLVFSCRAGDCTLVQVWSGRPGAAYSFPMPKNRDYEASLIVVPLRRDAE